MRGGGGPPPLFDDPDKMYRNDSQNLASAAWLFSMLAFVVAIAAEFLSPGYTTTWNWVPFLASLLFIGMPHGTPDLAAVADQADSRSAWMVVRKFSVYLALMLLTLCAMLLAPGWALIGFGIISGWHFGRSDCGTSTFLGWVRSLCRGAFVIGLPILFGAEFVRPLCDDWLSLLGADQVSNANWAFVNRVMPWLVGGAGMVWLGAVGLLFLANESDTALQEAYETVTLLGAFAILNPVFALGLYFLCWHSLRHLAAHEGGKQTLLGMLTGLSKRSLPLFVPTIIAYAICAWLLVGAWSPALLLALLVIFFAVVTPAHEYLHFRLAWKSQTVG